jgi:hypothetical protein
MADPMLPTPGQIVAPPDWETLHQQHGGIKSSVMVPLTDSRVQALIMANPDLAATLQQHPIYRYYMGDGSFVEAYAQENGEDVQIVDYKPSQKFQQQQAQAQAAQSPANQRTAREEAEIKRNASLPPDQDPRAETDRERAERADATRKAQGEAARQAQLDQERRDAAARAEANTAADNRRADETAARQAAAGGTVVERPDGSYIIKPDGTATKVQGVPPPDAPKGTLKDTPEGTFLVSADGKTATKVQGLPAPQQSPYTQVSQDPDTKKWYGLNKSGQWVEMQGGPGSAAPSTTPGPPLPTIIVGHSQDALRQYSSDLNAAVSAGMTPAERDKRWNEALQTATMTINEATLQQRENEANLNASTNLANTRMSASTSGFNSALDFVSKLNSTLPEKSNLGGKAFAAILELQVMQAHKMGAYDNIEPGSQPSAMGRGGDRASPAPPSAPASSPAPATASPDAATIEAQRQQAAAASADVPPAAPPDETPSAPALVSQAPATPPAAVDPNDQVMIESASGSRMMVPRGMVGEGPGQYSASPSRGGYRVVDAASAPQINPATGEPTGLPAAPINPPAGEPGQNPNAPVGQADPTGGYAVLAQARQPSPAEVTPMPVEPSAVALQQYPTAPPAPSANDMPPALLHTQARINPVWRLDEQTVQRMRAAGVPDEVIFGVPGAAA